MYRWFKQKQLNNSHHNHIIDYNNKKMPISSEYKILWIHTWGKITIFLLKQSSICRTGCDRLLLGIDTNHNINLDAKLLCFIQVKKKKRKRKESSVIGITIWLFSFYKKMSMQTSKIEGTFFSVFRQNEAKEEKSTMWLESVIYQKGRTEKRAQALQDGLAWLEWHLTFRLCIQSL